MPSHFRKPKTPFRHPKRGFRHAWVGKLKNLMYFYGIEIYFIIHLKIKKP